MPRGSTGSGTGRCSRADTRDCGELVGVGRDVGGVLGTRPDKRHLATQHVQELRDLVQLRMGEEPSDAAETGIVDDGERQPGGVSRHLAELVHVELPAAIADAARPVDHRPGLVEHDGERDHEPEGRGQDDQQAAKHHIDSPRQERQRAVEHDVRERAEGQREEHGQKCLRRREAPPVDEPARCQRDHQSRSCRQ